MDHRIEGKYLAAGLAVLLTTAACAPAAPLPPNAPKPAQAPGLAQAVEGKSLSSAQISQDFITEMLHRKALIEVDPQTPNAHPGAPSIFPAKPENFFGQDLFNNLKLNNKGLVLTKLADAPTEFWRPLKNPLALLNGERAVWVAVRENQLALAPLNPTWQEAAANPALLQQAFSHVKEASLILTLPPPQSHGYTAAQIADIYEQSIKRFPDLYEQIAQMSDPTGLIGTGKIVRVIESLPNTPKESYIIARIPGKLIGQTPLTKVQIGQIGQALDIAATKPVLLNGDPYLSSRVDIGTNLYIGPKGQIFTLGEQLGTQPANLSMPVWSKRDYLISGLAEQLEKKPALLAETGLKSLDKATIKAFLLRNFGPATAGANLALIIAQISDKPLDLDEITIMPGANLLQKVDAIVADQQAQAYPTSCHAGLSGRADYPVKDLFNDKFTLMRLRLNNGEFCDVLRIWAKPTTTEGTFVYRFRETNPSQIPTSYKGPLVATLIFPDGRIQEVNSPDQDVTVSSPTFTILYPDYSVVDVIYGVPFNSTNPQLKSRFPGEKCLMFNLRGMTD